MAMEMTTLGRTGLRVSRLGFGGAPLGLQNYLTADDRDSEAFRREARQALQAAVRLGVNYVDTAPGYGNGRSEALIGEALEPLRDRVVLATKYGFRPDDSDDQRTDALRASLDRLRTDRVDVLQLHGDFFDDAAGQAVLDSGILDWARRMQARGLCRFCGITAEGPSGALERLLSTGAVDVLQIAYNAIYQAACDYQRTPRGIIPFARALGIGIVTMRSTTCQVLPRLVQRVCPQADADALTRLAIQFVLSTPEVDVALAGMRTVAEVRANASLADSACEKIDLRALHRRYV